MALGEPGARRCRTVCTGVQTWCKWVPSSVALVLVGVDAAGVYGV